MAVSFSGERSLPIGDPRLPEPMPELSLQPEPEPAPELIPELTPTSSPKLDDEPEPVSKPEPKSAASPAPWLELIEQGREMPAGPDIVPLDEYEGYAPGLSLGKPPVYNTFRAGGCYRPGGCRVPGSNPLYAPPLGHLWMRFNTLLWRIQGFHGPTPVAGSAGPAPPRFSEGALGEPDASVVRRWPYGQPPLHRRTF